MEIYVDMDFTERLSVETRITSNPARQLIGVSAAGCRILKTFVPTVVQDVVTRRAHGKS